MSKLIQLTLERAKKLEYGDIVYEKGNYDSIGSIRKWRVNGKVKTWKRDISRIKIPIKHGLYDYGYITEDNLSKVLIEE